MAAGDYKLCDVCGGKAFYDSNVTDPHYTATWDDSEEAEPIGLAVLCAECHKTHEAIVQPRSAPAGYVPASEVQTAREEAPPAESVLCADILAELARARAKFPGRNVTFAALIEEVGELATAIFEEGSDRVRKEAIQVAVMAMRMILDGDHAYEPWRQEKGLDPLDPLARAATINIEATP